MSARRGRSAGFARRAPAPEGPGAAAVTLLLLAAPLWVSLLRHSVAEVAAVDGVAPDVALAAAAAAAWTRPSAAGAAAFALVLAGLGDVASDVPWGLAAARLAVLTALFAGAARVLAGAPVPGSSLLVVGAFALVERLAAALTLSVWVPEADLHALALRGAAIAAYTALLGPVAFAVARRLAPEPRRGRR